MISFSGAYNILDRLLLLARTCRSARTAPVGSTTTAPRERERLNGEFKALVPK